jgi:hypothetical protein
VAVLLVPALDLSYPTLGPALADFIEERFVFGPGSLAGQPARLDDEKRGALYRLYEVYPRGHRLGGRRRFQRGSLEWRKGLAKTEFAAWVCGLELHPEAPVRFDHWDGDEPVGRPVSFPYIPMMATTEEQVSELAYGVLKYVLEESVDADLFDISLERIVRLNDQGRGDGMAVPVSNSPGSRDGALTTFQHFDEPHRLFLPRQLAAHETMSANLTKRPLEDPWAFYTSTAGEPGQNSIQEQVRGEAEKIDRGEIEDPALFFFARWAGDQHVDLMPRPATKANPEVTPARALENRIAAIAEATGPAGEYGPGQFESIAKNWDRPKADTSFLERVWLNRWRRAGSKMFDAIRIREVLAKPGLRIADGAFVTLGFDGARYRDSTALVATDIETGLQELLGLWERPQDVDEWEVPEDEVTALLQQTMERLDVWKLYGDPPHWTESMGSWAGRWPDQVEEWWTANRKRMAYAIREYQEAQRAGTVTFGGVDDPDRDFQAHSDFLRHLGNVAKKDTRLLDDEGQPLYIMAKPDGRLEDKIDAGMAGNLSWKARLDAIAAGAKPRKKPKVRIRRIR